MMKDVEPPQELNAVLGAVLPILKQIPNQGTDEEREKLPPIPSKPSVRKSMKPKPTFWIRIGGAERKERRQRAYGEDVHNGVAQIERVIFAGDALRRKVIFGDADECEHRHHQNEIVAENDIQKPA
jgi:hypothetical protein